MLRLSDAGAQNASWESIARDMSGGRRDIMNESGRKSCHEEGKVRRAAAIGV